MTISKFFYSLFAISMFMSALLLSFLNIRANVDINSLVETLSSNEVDKWTIVTNITTKAYWLITIPSQIFLILFSIWIFQKAWKSK